MIAIRIIAVVVVIAALMRIISAAVSPDGYLTARTDITDPSPYISEPKPSQRLELEAGPPYRVVGDPIYFDVRPPSEFENVTVVARYRNRGQSLVEIGALANRLDGQFDMRPAENQLVDSLSWPRITSGDVTLLQRKKIYNSVDSFLREPPDSSRVAMYRTVISWPHEMSSHITLDEPKSRVVSLRGNHRILTYVEQEPLSFSFKVQDMNRQEGADPVTLSVYREGEQDAVARTVLEDDGNTKDNQKSSGLRNVSLTLPYPISGLYRIEFTASGDVFIRELSTRQNKFVFLNRLYLGDHVGYSDQTLPVTVFVGGRSMVARTAHEEALQKVKVDKWEVDLREPHTRYFSWLDKGGGPFEIISPKRDVLLETDGVFALSPDDYFNPLPMQLDWYMNADDLASSGIDFILTEYESPKMAVDTTVAEATFEVSRLATTEDGEYRFAISAPGIGVTRKDLALESVKFIFFRDPVGWIEGIIGLLDELGWQVTDRETAVILSDGWSYSEEVE